MGSLLPYATHDGAGAQWIAFGRLFAAASRVASWREKLAIFVAHPGYLPPGITLPEPTPARLDEAIPRRVRVYVALAFGALLIFATPLLWQRDRFTLGTLGLGALLVFVGLSTLGGLLDGRAGGIAHERARLLLTIAITPWLARTMGAPASALAVASVLALVATWRIGPAETGLGPS